MRILLFSLLTILGFTPVAQSQMVWCPPGAVWHFSANGFAVDGYTKVTYVGDTMIAGKQTKVLEKEKHTYNYIDETFYDAIIGYDYTYLSNDTVYYYRHEEFYPLYIFNANPSDIWSIAGWGPFPCDTTDYTIVDSTGTTTINSEVLKEVYVSASPAFQWQFTGTITERIGCTGYMFPEPTCLADVNEGGPLRCYYDDSFGLYQPSATPCDFVIGLDDKVQDRASVSIFPNPAADLLSVETDNFSSGDLGITVCSMLGDELLRLDNMVENSSFDLSSLSPGLYFVTVEDNSNPAITKTVKLLKQ